MLRTVPLRPSLIAATALLLTGCAGISPPADVSGIQKTIGDALPGAQGLTLQDQERIDETVARGCAAGVFSKDRCADHTLASAVRRRRLKTEATAKVAAIPGMS